MGTGRARRPPLISNPVVRQIGVLAASRLVAALLSAALFVVAARQLDVRDFADFALLLALGAMVTAIHDFGYPLIVADHVKRAPGTARAAVREVLWRRLALALAGAGVTGLLYISTAARPSIGVPAVFMFSLLSTAWYTTATAALRSLQAVRPEALADVGSRVLVLATGTAVLGSGGGVKALVTVYAVADGLAALYLWSALRARMPAQEGAPAPGFASLRRAAPVAAGGIVGVVYYRVDTWLVGVLDDPVGVASYASAYRVLDGVLLAAGAVAVMVLPTTSGLDSGTAARHVRRLAGIGCSMVAVPAAIIMVFAPVVMAVVFGSEFKDAAGLLRVLMLTALPATVVAICAPRLVLLERGRFGFRLLVYLLANVALNVVLIPLAGPSGAAWATLACQTTLAIDLWHRAGSG